MKILGCRVNEAILASWEQRIVFEREPIFVAEAEHRLLPTGAVILSGAELGANHALAPLDLFDSYDLYRMDRKGLHVAFLTPAEFWEMEEEPRQELMALQVSRGRGQIYAEDWTRRAGVLLHTGRRDRVVTADGGRIALRQDVWNTFAPDERRRWLLQFVGEGRKSCLSAVLRPEQWERIDAAHGQAIRLLAGTFAPVSGPNCFATVLAAATAHPQTAVSIAGHWLHPEPFLRGLAERGFANGGKLEGDGSNLVPGDVLVWVDGTGRPQHTCYYLGDGLALNKDGQAWFIPRQIRPLPDVLDGWQHEGFTVRVFTRR